MANVISVSVPVDLLVKAMEAHIAVIESELKCRAFDPPIKTSNKEFDGITDDELMAKMAKYKQKLLDLTEAP